VPKFLRLLCANVLTVFALMLAGVPAALAHYLDLAQFSIYQKLGTSFRLDVSLPINLDPLSPVSWPAGCSVLDRADSTVGNSVSVSFDVVCEQTSPGIIQTRWGRDGALLELHLLDGTITSTMLPGGRLGAAITVPDWDIAALQEPDGFLKTAWRYLELGTVHVLIGLDHLAFVLCLAMMARGIPLVWLISAFTLGHSVSLALAHFGLLNVPIVPVEAVIALSVVFMAREALLAQKAQTSDIGRTETQSLRWRMGLTAGFGLIHGLGFASVLGSLGVSASQTIVALAFFNIGVEVGQLLFVFTVLGVLWLVRRINLDQQLIRASAFAVGGLGIFWTLERILGV
jgi:hypothetical protein